MLQVTRSPLVCTESPEALARMRRSFDEHHAIRLPRFLHPDLVALVQHAIRDTSFYDRVHDDIAREQCMSDNSTLAMLWLLMNDTRLFDVIQRITGCPPIGYFGGRVYLMSAAAGHYDRWHSDMSDGRLIGMSINLTDREFQGGAFELRRVSADSAEWSMANTGPGDVILFRIDHNLRHRVTPVVGSIPRVAFAGWFQQGPDLLTRLKTGADAPGGMVKSMQYTDPSATS
jgi:hypothetical protein